MKDEFKKMWGRFRSWLKYVREYHDNKDYCEIKEAENKQKDEEIEELKDKIKELEITSKIKDELIEKKENRIEILNAKISELMKEKRVDCLYSTNALYKVLKEATGETKKIKKVIKKSEVK